MQRDGKQHQGAFSANGSQTRSVSPLVRSNPARSRPHVAAPDPSIVVAVIGLGPWGLATLERLAVVAERRGLPAVLHAVEPRTPGSGIFGGDQPDYLMLNTPCGQHLMYPDDASPERPPYALSLYEWAVSQGYHWVDGRCSRSGAGQPLSPDDFLPRRLMGEWLEWCFERLVDSTAPWVSIVHHPNSAVSLEPVAYGERVTFDDGRSILVDHVFLTTGHTPDCPRDGVNAIAPYPVSRLQSVIKVGESVAVAGLGLVSLDVTAALTVGRGGRFEERDDRLVYMPSGQEPSILLYSRSGQPYGAKVEGASDPTGEYVPVICTTQAIAALRETAADGRNRGQLDFCRDVLPLIVAEMKVRFYRQNALAVDDHATAQQVSEHLARAWEAGCFDTAVERYAAVYGCFDIEEHVLGDSMSTFLTGEEYQNDFYKRLAADLAEATHTGSVSPVKAACETLRVLRDDIRHAVEFQGLTLDSYRDFQSRLSNRMKAAVAGPPARRNRELLALIDAGVVRLPWGPSPRVHTEHGRIVIESTALTSPHRQEVDHLVRGFLPEPTIGTTRSALLQSLYVNGRIRPFRYDDVEVGSIDLTDEMNPIGRSGQIERTISVFGPLTEGVRYFTQYVPSPKSRVRAFRDAEECAERICEALAASALYGTDDLALAGPSGDEPDYLSAG